MLSLIRRKQAETPVDLYCRAVGSVVSLMGCDDQEKPCWATGVFVDRGLILTAWHALAGSETCHARFPRPDATGRIVTFREYYFDEPPIPCSPIYGEPDKDLALLKIEGDAPPLSLAAAGVAPGEQLLMLGCGGDVMWRLALVHAQQSGRVVHRYRDGHYIDVDSVITTKLSGPGDSGAPLLNMRGELAGIHVAACPRYGWAVSAWEIAAFIGRAKKTGRPE